MNQTYVVDKQEFTIVQASQYEVQEHNDKFEQAKRNMNVQLTEPGLRN